MTVRTVPASAFGAPHLDLVQVIGPRCIVCGAKPVTVGAYHPGDYRHFARPPADSKRRRWVYMLCGDHWRSDPATTEAVVRQVVRYARFD